MRRAAWLGAAPAVASLLLAGCTDGPVELIGAADAVEASLSAVPATLRTGKGDLVTGDAAVFTQALEEIGPDGEILVWLKETGTARPSAEFLVNLPGSASETIALATGAPGAQRRSSLGPSSVRGSSLEAVIHALAQAGVVAPERMETLPVIAVKLPANVRLGALRVLLRHPNVDYVSAVRTRPVELLAAPVGTNSIDAKHTVHKIPQVWDLTRGSGGKVGIMDSGLARSAYTGLMHEDARFFTSYGVSAHGFVDDDCSGTPNSGTCTPYDDNGHGTAMVGLVGSNDNGLGYVGISPQAITYSMKIAWNTYVHGHCRDEIFSNTTYCIEDDDFIRAVDWAAARRLHVLSMSFSTNLGGDAYRALATARNSYGVFLVAATGNTVGGSPQEPASLDVVMGIAGVDEAGNNLFSTAARDVSGYAGGATLAATCSREYYCDAGSPGRYGGTGGTSAATANVAGIVGLIRSYYPSESPAQVWNRLVNTAEGTNRVVNAYAAITYRPPLSVSISGPTSMAQHEYGSWTATASSGTSPYTYTWYENGVQVATGATYETYSGSSDFTLKVIAGDAAGATATRQLTVNVIEPCADCQIQ